MAVFNTQSKLISIAKDLCAAKIIHFAPTRLRIIKCYNKASIIGITDTNAPYHRQLKAPVGNQYRVQRIEFVLHVGILKRQLALEYGTQHDIMLLLEGMENLQTIAASPG